MLTTAFAGIERLESRRLLTAPVPVYEIIGADAWSPPQGTEYIATGNRGDRCWAEDGVMVNNPSSGYTAGHPTGHSTSFSVYDIPKHTELKIDIGWGPSVPRRIQAV
jgi:hypothetical protein